MIFLIFLFFAAKSEPENEMPGKFGSLKAYLIGLEEKRKMQLDFVLKMAKNQNSGKMAKMAFATVIETLQTSQKQLEKVDFEPEILRPKEGEQRNLANLEAVSQVYENVAFLGDFARRLPHLLVEWWSTTSEQSLIQWAFDRTQESIVYEYDMWRIGHQPGTEKASLLYLPCYFLQQELKLGEVDPDYVNEFRIIRDRP